jgi:hypothetical protein
VLLIIGPQERFDSHDLGVGSSRRRRGRLDAQATLCASWRSRIAHRDRER